MPPVRKVFISHTSEFVEYPEKRSFIDAAVAAVNRAGCLPCDMTYFTAQDDKPAEYCEKCVQECDIYVGVIGLRYGSPVRDRLDVSYTELEFEAASETSTIKRFIFLLDPDAPVPVGRFTDLKYGHRQERFRERLSNAGVMCKSFSNADQLELLIFQALKEDKEESQREVVYGTGNVRKGPFRYGDQELRVELNYDYWIDLYPVTNEKYRAFIEAGGYDCQRNWSEDGWVWKTKNNIAAPEYWDDADWNKADHPVVGVSYYEAEAYSKWVGKRLPTEREWEKAARGDKDGRRYPWGEHFDQYRCNSNRSSSGHTTPVTQYPNGKSQYGCYDMVGNVWEWCSDWYDESQSQRVLRGGSWFYGPDRLRVSNRYIRNPAHRTSDIGFRLAQDIL